jgi:hypothetical protein
LLDHSRRTIESTILLVLFGACRQSEAYVVSSTVQVCLLRRAKVAQRDVRVP